VRGGAGGPHRHVQFACPAAVPGPAVHHDARSAATAEVTHEHLSHAPGVRGRVGLDDEDVSRFGGVQDGPEGGAALHVLLVRAGGDVLPLRHELERAGRAHHPGARPVRPRSVDERAADTEPAQLGARGSRAHRREPVDEAGNGPLERAAPPREVVPVPGAVRTVRLRRAVRFRRAEPARVFCRHEVIPHPFVAPVRRPLIKRRCMNRKKMTAGATASRTSGKTAV
jgi:hypothetical protein